DQRHTRERAGCDRCRTRRALLARSRARSYAAPRVRCMPDIPDPGRSRAQSSQAHQSLPADTSLAARESAERFVERLAVRAPDHERYSNEGEIARGGMGAILKVRDEILRRELAMKVLLERESEGDDESTSGSSRSVLLARFLEEAQVT